MTHDVPQPLPGPPVPPQKSSGPTGGSFDPSSVDRFDWAILGIGFVVLVFSFFDYYSWDFKAGNITLGTVSWSAWHFGHGLFIAWFAMVLTVLGAVVVALSIFVPTVTLPARGLGY